MNLLKSLVLLTITVLAGCAPSLVFEDTIPDLSAPSGMGLVVYMRTVDMPEFKVYSTTTSNGRMGSAVSIDQEGAESKVYVDGQYVGGTKSGCLTVFKIDNGAHIISACDELCGRLKINVESGKVYYVEEMPIPMGPLGTRFNIQFITKEEANQKLKTIQYKLSKPNPENREDNLDSDDAQEELEDWNEWANENPEKAKIEEDYHGY